MVGKGCWYRGQGEGEGKGGWRGRLSWGWRGGWIWIWIWTRGFGLGLGLGLSLECEVVEDSLEVEVGFLVFSCADGGSFGGGVRDLDHLREDSSLVVAAQGEKRV